MNNSMNSYLSGGGPDPDSSPAYSIPMTTGGVPRRGRVTYNPGPSYGDSTQPAALPTPALGATLGFQQEQRQRMLGNMGVVSRGPSPGFSAMQAGKIGRGDTTALDPSRLPQFDPTGGQHERTVENLDAARPIMGGRSLNIGTGAAGGTNAPGQMNSQQFWEAVAHARGEGPGALSTDEAVKRVQDEMSKHGQPSTQPSSPGDQPPTPPEPPMLGTIARPRLKPGEANPATGETSEQAHANDQTFQPDGASIHPSEQNARAIWAQIMQQHGTDLEGAEKQFIIHMQHTYGVDGRQLINQWKQAGNERQTQFAQPGQTQPAQPYVASTLDQTRAGSGLPAVGGAAGGAPNMVRTPDGRLVMVDAHGQQVGGTMAQGAPLPPRPVMGPQPGYTPAPVSEGATPANQAPTFNPTSSVSVPQMPTPNQPTILNGQMNPYEAFVQGMGRTSAPTAAPVMGSPATATQAENPGNQPPTPPAPVTQPTAQATPAPAAQSATGLKPLPKSLVLQTFNQFLGDPKKATPQQVQAAASRAKAVLAGMGYDVNQVHLGS